MQQLDGIETLKAVFRVRLVATGDGMDFKLQAWTERHTERQAYSAKSKLAAAWRAGGRTVAEREQRLANIQPLSGYEMELLEKAAVRVA